jgi:hypothetical protein
MLGATNSYSRRSGRGAQGLAEDVRYYGKWMRDEAEKRIGHLYPKVEVTAAMALERPDLGAYVGEKLTVIAWLWARTVKSPNPAFASVDVPLAATFILSAKPGKEAFVEPMVEKGCYRFAVNVGLPKDAASAKNGTKLSRGANLRVVTVIDSGPIKIIDSSRQYRWRADRSVPVVGNGTVLPVAQRRRCQPPGVRRTWPPRSSESSALPNRSLLTASASRSRVRVNTAP